LTRENIEPATISNIMSRFDVSKETEGYDISNACLGIADGIESVADSIELGRTKSGIVLGFEDSRRLLINTLYYLKAHYRDKKDKRFFREMTASLTLGSSAVALSLNRGSGLCRVLGFYELSNTKKSYLCTGKFGKDGPIMATDAPALQESGIPLVRDAVKEAMNYFKLSRADVAITHQVGKAHQEAVKRELSGIADIYDFTTYQDLGNMGANSWPITLAMAIERRIVQPGHKVMIIPFASGLFTKPILLQF
jgi:3-oxoacyl-[acyl-carrier-protein] synthase-3